MELVAPIFLVGFPRSGTTFLQSLIATQQDIFSYPESHFYTVLTGHLPDSSTLDRPQLEDMVTRARDRIGMTLDIQALSNGMDGAESRIERKHAFINTLHSIAKNYNLPGPGTNGRLLEKTPVHAWHLSQIISDFPDARIVYIQRHPVDSISSHYFKLSKGQRPISALIDDWVKTHDHVQEFIKHHPDRCLTVKYEELMAHREKVMEQIMDFVDLPLDVKALDSHSEIASRYILEREVWKEGNTKGLHTHNTKRQLALKDMLTIQFRCSSRMKEQGYTSRNPLLQRLYDWKNRANA